MKRSYQLSLFAWGALFFLCPSYGGDIPYPGFTPENQSYPSYPVVSFIPSSPIVSSIPPFGLGSCNSINPKSQKAYLGCPYPIINREDPLNGDPSFQPILSAPAIPQDLFFPTEVPPEESPN